ncbi:MAG: spore coat protein CotJB [Clostridia bacterium]|nr:spore coat protein CotJB [Clostridia bacterium]MBQ3554345.1 spore coat protein CotJB [Clostridia bacterium]
MNRNQMLKQLMEYDFVQYDLNLYLDTHPEDQKALKIFESVSEKAAALRKEFEAKFGPVTASQNNSVSEWRWLSAPWPWEN